MSLVSNYISGISNIADLTGVTSGYNLDDTAFAELLEKQMENRTQEIDSNSSNIMSGLGMPPGLHIENLDGTEFSETVMDQMEVSGDMRAEQSENNASNPFDTNKDGDVTASEAVDFFTSLLDNGSEGQNARSELFDFARKQAVDVYNTYSKGFVNNLRDFVEDVQGMVS